MLLDRLSVEHASKFKQIIATKNIKTNVLAAIGRVTAEAAKEQPIDKDIFVIDGKLCRVKGVCNIEPVISSEHRRYFEIHSMRGTHPALGQRLKPNPNEAMRLIANALMCNRRPHQHLLIWVNGENTKSFFSNFKNIAGGYAVYISAADSILKASGTTSARVAIIENSSNTKALETKLNRLPGTVFPVVVSETNDLTSPDCGADWLVFKYSPPSGQTPETLFADLIQAANPNQTEVAQVSVTTSDDLINESVKAVIKEFVAQSKWSPTGATTESQRKSIPVKSIKSELSVMAAKKGIKTVSQKSIVHAFQSYGFSVTNPKNVLSITCYQ